MGSIRFAQSRDYVPRTEFEASLRSINREYRRRDDSSAIDENMATTDELQCRVQSKYSFLVIFVVIFLCSFILF